MRKKSRNSGVIPTINVKLCKSDQRCNHTNNCCNTFYDFRARPWNAQDHGEGQIAVGVDPFQFYPVRRDLVSFVLMGAF